jgi:hypothetical protein
LFELVTVPIIWAAQDRPPLGDVLTFLAIVAVSLARVIASVATLSRRRSAVVA